MVRRSQKSGFTLIELTISTLVIAIMAGIAAPFFFQAIDAWTYGVTQTYRWDQHRDALALFSSDVESASAVQTVATNSVQLTIQGTSVTYSLVADGGGAFRLVRTSGGTDVVVARDVSAMGFRLRYFDMGHQETAQLSSIRVIMMTLITQTGGQNVASGTSAVVNAQGDIALTRL